MNVLIACEESQIICNLPLLRSTEIIVDHIPYVTSGSYSLTHNKKYIGVSRAGGAARVRSKTFYGIASAMALQWG